MASTAKSFVVVSVPVSGKPRAHARFSCACGETLALPLRHSALNPEAVAKAARDLGWAAQAYRGKVLCPKCNRPGGKAGAAEETNVVTLHTRPQAPTVVSAGQPTAPTPAAPPAPPRPATTEERLAIRALLDKHFDDAAGYYLDGYDDQRVGRECCVPWAIVAHMREVAYGPIRVNPAIAALERQHSALGDRVGVLAAELERLANNITTLRDEQGVLAQRIAALRPKGAA